MIDAGPSYVGMSYTGTGTDDCVDKRRARVDSCVSVDYGSVP